MVMVTDHHKEGRWVLKTPRAPFYSHKNEICDGIGHGMVTLGALILLEV